MSKPFLETGLGKFLSSKGFDDVLKMVGNVVPAVGVLETVKTAVLGSPQYKQLSDDDQHLFLQLHQIELDELKEANRHDEEEQSNVTERWKADMLSDSPLSKNSRPVVLLYSWFLITIIIVTALCGVQLPDIYLNLVFSLFGLVNTAYFGMRGWEKLRAIKN